MNPIRNQKGMSVFVIVLILVSMIVLIQQGSRFAELNRTQNHYISVVSDLQMMKGNLEFLLRSGSSWQKTIENAPASAQFSCLIGAGSPCTSDNTPAGTLLADVPFPIYDGAGTLFYDSTVVANGFDFRGQPCAGFVMPPAAGNPQCPFRYEIRWTPKCASPAACVKPRVIIKTKLIINAGPKNSLILNPENYLIPDIER